MNTLNENDIIYVVYHKMINNPDLAGSFEIVNGLIHWDLFDQYKVVIGPNYIGIDKYIVGKIIIYNFHWHPEDEDLYSDVCKLGSKGNVTVIHQSIGGSIGMDGGALIYSGPRSMCPITRRWFFGRYIYLYAE